GAVAGAGAEAGRGAGPRAVEAALREVLTSAELRRRLQAAPAARPGMIRRAARALGRGLAGALKGCRGWAAGLAGRCRAKVTAAGAAVRAGREELAGRVRHRMTALARRAWLGGATAVLAAGHCRRPVLVAVAAGTLVGLGCYVAGPAVSSLVGGLAGFAGTLAAGVRGRWRPGSAAGAGRPPLAEAALPWA